MHSCFHDTRRTIIAICCQIWNRLLPAHPKALDDDRLAKVHNFFYQRYALSKYFVEGRRKVEADLEESLRTGMRPDHRFSHRAFHQDELTKVLEQRAHRFLQVYGYLYLIEGGL
jgi:hypothetical protein